jgi:surface polysaccharide O-acyltransferase-like enzyme
MGEVKAYIVMVIGAIFTLISPIQNFMYAMVLLFGVNFLFGLIAAIVNKEEWSTKKALMFFAYCAIFFVTAASVFIIGHFMDEEAQAISVVKMLCFLAIYVFGTNICRNWMNILNPGTAWYKFVDLLYYILSVKFIERFKVVKNWQDDREKGKMTGRTILDKDDN